MLCVHTDKIIQSQWVEAVVFSLCQAYIIKENTVCTAYSNMVIAQTIRGSMSYSNVDTIRGSIIRQYII